MDNTREFIKTIDSDFERWCESKEIEATNELFLLYLIERNIIEEKTIKRFVVVKNYPSALEENLGIKAAAIWQLEEKTGVNGSTIKSWLDRFQAYFRPSF